MAPQKLSYNQCTIHNQKRNQCTKRGCRLRRLCALWNSRKDPSFWSHPLQQYPEMLAGTTTSNAVEISDNPGFGGEKTGTQFRTEFSHHQQGSVTPPVSLPYVRVWGFGPPILSSATFCTLMPSLFLNPLGLIVQNIFIEMCLYNWNIISFHPRSDFKFNVTFTTQLPFFDIQYLPLFLLLLSSCMFPNMLQVPGIFLPFITGFSSSPSLCFPQNSEFLLH